MPLDRVNGERIEGLTGHVVVPNRALAEMSNLLTITETWNGLRRVQRKTPIFDDAVARAMQAFKVSGSLQRKAFDDEDILVQIYPHDLKIVVMFQRRVAGEEMFYTAQYGASPQAIADLLGAAGKPRRTH